jgi:hypothetical protein
MMVAVLPAATLKKPFTLYKRIGVALIATGVGRFGDVLSQPVVELADGVVVEMTSAASHFASWMSRR